MPALEPARTVQLDRLVDHPLRRLGREELGLRGAGRDLGAVRRSSLSRPVVRSSGSAYEQPAGLDPGRHLGQRVLRGLLVDQPATEQLPLGRPGQARVERGLGHADRERADARPEQVEGPHRDAEPLVDLAEDVVPGDPDPVEVDGAEGVRRHHVQALAAQARAVAAHRERRHAPRPGARCGAGEEGVDVGVGGVGDPGLGAVQRPAVTVRPCLEGEGGGVRAGVGLGECERGYDVAAHDAGQPALAGGLVARLEDRVGAEALKSQRRLGLRVDLREPLAEQAQLHRGRVAGWVAGLATEEGPEQAELAQPGDQRPVDRAVDGWDVREVRSNPAYPLQELLLAGGQPVVSCAFAHVADHTGDVIAS